MSKEGYNPTPEAYMPVNDVFLPQMEQDLGITGDVNAEVTYTTTPTKGVQDDFEPTD